MEFINQAVTVLQTLVVVIIDRPQPKEPMSIYEYKF